MLLPARPEPPPLRVDVVTPRTAPRFLWRIGRGELEADHLCLEMVHWGYNEAIAWIARVRVLCGNNPCLIPPMVSVHGLGEEATPDMVAEILDAGARWWPRVQPAHLGKDCRTIVLDRTRAAAAGPPWEDFDLMDSHDPLNPPAYDLVELPARGIPEEEFEAMLQQNFKELNRD